MFWSLSSHAHNLCRTCASRGLSRMHPPVKPATVTNLGDCHSYASKHRDYPEQLPLASVNACEQLLLLSFFLPFFFPSLSIFPSFFLSFFLSFWQIYMRWWAALTTLRVERMTDRAALPLCKVAFHPSWVLACKAVFLKGKVACQLTLIFLYIMHARK